MKKSLVAYFSCSGDTAKLAQTLALAVDGELFEIEPQVPYTDADLDWKNNQSRSTLEMKDKSSRPAIKRMVENLEQYDTVFVGFPIWWFIAPTIINTFLESGDFSGKTIVPFATSGGSGVGETDRYLHGSCSAETQWRPAKKFYTSSSVSNLKAWVAELNL